ncbi:unnamed protein product [Symbiodinium microadriaticum]|nr:unnamed protein product [Symbiodinium microadriaticum]
MLTPLPGGPGQIVYIIRPPAALVQLGLAHPNERWQLTHGMYGLRQSPRLWSSFRDTELRKMRVFFQDKFWILRQGAAEPNMWLIYEEGAEEFSEPAGLVLVYVDDILLSGPLGLVRATSSTIRSVWKASELEVLDVDHEIRLRSYLQRTKNLALALKPTNNELTIYTDSSFAPEGSKSHSGMVAVWLGAPVCWRSSKQPFICLSTAECELLAATEGLVMGKSIASVLNQMVKNVETDQVEVVFVAGKSQWADLLTKSFPRQRLEELVGLWGFVDVVAEVSKVTMARMLVACMMVQTARAQEEDPLSLTTSFDLYIMVILLGIAVVAAWEFLWWCLDRDDPKGDRATNGRKKPGRNGIITGEDALGRDYGENPVGIVTYHEDIKACDTFHEGTEAIYTYIEETYAFVKDIWESNTYDNGRSGPSDYINGVFIVCDCFWAAGYEFPNYYKRSRGPD